MDLGLHGRHDVRTPKVDPIDMLERDIRRKLLDAGSLVGATSQMQQVEATLLQALAVCLQTKMLARIQEETLIALRDRDA